MGTPTELARLLDRRRLRALTRGLGTSPVLPSGPPEPDSELVDLLGTPFGSVEDVRERLARLEATLRAAADRRAVFATIYTRMTGQVGAGIEDGAFADSDWMRSYTVTFAEYYRRAFLAFERGQERRVPAPWRIAFGAALGGETLVAQDAFLGINAHINYDLALALGDVGIDPGRREKHADHRRIDGLLADLVDAQQMALVELYAPGLADVDRSLGRFDEALSLVSMTEGRAQAWRLAVVLTDVEWRPVRRYARWVLRTTATGGATFVQSPPVDPGVMATLRRVERSQPVDALLEAFAETLDRV